VGDSREEISDKEYRVSIASKEEALSLPVEKGTSIAEHMNNYIKLLRDFLNVNVDIKEEDKTLIFLNSLPDEEYKTFVLTFNNGKQSLNYNDISIALVNYKVRRKDK